MIKAALYPMAGALLTIASGLALGLILFRKLNITLQRLEHHALAFLTGSACLSVLVLVIAACHGARKGVFFLLAAGLIFWAYYRRPRTQPAAAPFATPARLPILFAVIAIPYFFMYLLIAWAPEVSPDGSTYHLGNVLRYWAHHGLLPIRDIYGALPEGLEMLFLFAFSIGRHPSAALVHFSFLVALVLALIAYGRRFGSPKAGFLAAVLVLASPVIGKDATAAYNDVALAATAFGAFYVIELWREEHNHRVLVVAGLLAGFSFAIKYTGFLVIVYVSIQVLWHIRTEKRRWSPALLFAVPCAILVLPWLIKNAVYMHNPVSPFLNALFPNPYVSQKFEKDYSDVMAHYAGTRNARELALRYTTSGINVDGFLGPMFLLAPLGIIVLRSSVGRRIALAAILFAVPIYFNTGTRFLLPAAPFLALSIAFAVMKTRFAVPVLMALHAIASWPSIAHAYCDRNAWRPHIVPLRTILNPTRAAKYLEENLGPGYRMAQILELQVRPGARIFCFSCPPQAYSSANLTIWYESLEGRPFVDALWAPDDATLQPRKQVTASFPQVTARSIRVRLLQSPPDQAWSVSEMRILEGGREVPRGAGWRIGASPDPWEAPFAFDNNPVSTWSTEHYGASNPFLEVTFDTPVTIDSVVLEIPPDSPDQIGIDADIANRGLSPVRATVRSVPVSPPTGMRRAAVELLKTYGFEYLILSKGDYHADDYKKFAAFWGIRSVAEVDDWTLYHLE